MGPLSSLRLNSLSSYYQDSHSVWDIGCDHGLLGLSFLFNKDVHAVHLVDPSIDVIEVLKKKLIDAYITIPDKIIIHHKKGQEIILNPESKTVFIAGMGGKEIGEILQSLEHQLGPLDRVVISPHRWIFELRSLLSHSSFRLFDEAVVKENNQFYQLICLKRDQQLQRVHPFGNKLWSSSVGQEYRDHLIRAYSLHKDTLSREVLAYLKALSN